MAVVLCTEALIARFRWYLEQTGLLAGKRLWSPEAASELAVYGAGPSVGRQFNHQTQAEALLDSWLSGLEEAAASAHRAFRSASRKSAPMTKPGLSQMKAPHQQPHLHQPLQQQQSLTFSSQRQFHHLPGRHWDCGSSQHVQWAPAGPVYNGICLFKGFQGSALNAASLLA